MTLILLLLISLSWSKTIPPPDYEFLRDAGVEYPVPLNMDRQSLILQAEKWSQRSSHQSIQLWSKYMRARLSQKVDPTKSCQLFTELSYNSRFLLSDLSKWRAREVCLNPSKKGPLFNWFKDIRLNIQMAKTQKEKKSQRYIDLLVLKSERSQMTSHKIQFLQKAIQHARESHLEKESLHKKLYALAPRFIPQPQPPQYFSVATDFLKTRQFQKALVYYQKVIDGDFSINEKIKALKGVRRLYKLKRDKLSHLKASRQLSAFIKRVQSKDPHLRELYFQSHIYLTKVYWTQGDQVAAWKTLQHIQNTGEHSMAKIYWLYGRMSEEKGDYAEALQWYNQSLKENFHNSEFKEKVMWYQAWNLRKLNQHNKAIEVLTQMTHTNLFNSFRYRYWMAVSHRELKQEKHARENFEKLIQEDPVGFYGLLAHRALKRPIEWPKVDSSESKRSWSDPFRRLQKNGFKSTYLEWLLAVSERKVAKLYLDEVSKHYRQQVGNHRENKKSKNHKEQEGWTQIFRGYALAGYYLEFFQHLGRLSGKDRTRVLSTYPNIVFPRPFHRDVQRASQQFGLSADYIYSIMRQESAFNPNARSFADAFGLLQVLPKWGTHKNFKIPYQRMEDLYKPSTNIQVGTAHLRQLWDQYNNQFILATAAYNASEMAVNGWVKTRYKGDALTFIEDIPYEETRSYVKLVMRNFIFYQVLNNKKATLFPESCLKMDPQRILGSTPHL